mgnify:CR=1 FL=1
MKAGGKRLISNFEAEQAVIGSIVLDPEKVMPVLLMDIQSDYFTCPEYRTLFEACKSLYGDSKAIDAVSLLSIVGSECKEIVLRAAESVPTLKNVKVYSELIKNAYRRREAQKKAFEVTCLIEESAEIDEISKVTSELQEILIADTVSSECNAVDGYISFLERSEKPKKYITTGLYTVNKYTYISHGDYIIVGGRPSAGKTALTLQMMLRMAEKETVVYFSLETNKEKIFDRLICNFCEIPFADIKNGEMARYYKKINDDFPRFKALDLHVVEASGWTVEQIKSKALQLKATVIMIDYLSLIQGNGNSTYEKVSNISIALHTMAQRTKIAVIALSQLSREGKNAPDMTSLRESGQIEQDADCILLLHTVEPDNPHSDRELIIAKNKEGQTGKIPLTFKGEYQKFYCKETRY